MPPRNTCDPLRGPPQVLGRDKTHPRVEDLSSRSPLFSCQVLLSARGRNRTSKARRRVGYGHLSSPPAQRVHVERATGIEPAMSWLATKSLTLRRRPHLQSPRRESNPSRQFTGLAHFRCATGAAGREGLEPSRPVLETRPSSCSARPRSTQDLLLRTPKSRRPGSFRHRAL